MPIKTIIGEHDFHKPPCAAYCKMSGEYCPYVNQGVDKISKVLRWTDIQDGNKEGIDVSFAQKQAEAQLLPNAEQNVEVRQGRYTCWGDGSGLEYDKMSRNVMGPGGPTESVYDISGYGVDHAPLNVTDHTWNAWVDKYQYDYRFGRVSDTNAECILFPNVDNPWMFTEYVFKGIGSTGKLDHWGTKVVPDVPKYFVVEPPLFDEDTLALRNWDSELGDLHSFDGKYMNASFVEVYQQPEGNSNSKSSSASAEPELVGYNVKQFRVVQDWDVMRDDIGGESYPCKDAGVVLYRASLPVQCIKWGEHGNIPPHTLDMTAPENWLDAGAITTAIKAVYKAHLGSSLYAEKDGYYYWGNVKDANGNDVVGMQGRQAYVVSNVQFSAVSIGGQLAYYQYPQVSNGGSPVDMPTELLSGVYKAMKPTEKVRGYGSQGEEICHAGCANCVGKGGRLRCNALDNETNSALKASIAAFFNPQKCMVAGNFSDCPSTQHPSISGRPILATYETSKTQTRQWGGDSQLMGYGMGLAASGAAVGGLAGIGAAALGASMLMAGILDAYIDLRRRGTATVSYEVTYELVSASTERPKLNKTKYNEFGKGVQIVPGTGKFAFDSKQNADVFQGGDTNVFNDINTLSFHRLFRSVMHCATQSNCNEFMGPVQSGGYSAYEKCGGDGKCRYYKKSAFGVAGCPYNCTPKRAVEFCEAAAAASRMFPTYSTSYDEMTHSGIWHDKHKQIFSDFDIDYEINGKWLVIAPNSESSWAYRQVSNEVCLLAVKGSPTQCSGDFGGIALVTGSSEDDVLEGFVLLGKFKTQHQVLYYSTLSGYVDENYEASKEEQDIVYKFDYYHVLDTFYWFHPVDNDGSDLSDADTLPLLKQHLTKSGANWFCRVETNFKVPKYNSVMVDNNDKFIGGWHPEYKDYSKIGGEFMQDIVSDESREGQGKGDYVQGQGYTPMPQTVNKKGYWIDQSGEYIVDERSTGIEEPIASDDAREEAGGGGNAVCISFKKSNTQINGETGKQIKPKTTNGAVFSNDPYDLVVTTFRDAKKSENGEQKGRPMFKDPETGAEYLAPLIMNNPELLPTARACVTCPSCGYYLAWKYHGLNCPWCGNPLEIVKGDIGKGMEQGSTWGADANVMRTFFKLYAIGNVDVWAPPGTCLRTDAYYWKHQEMITNGLKRQMYYRLGNSNKKAAGAAFAFDMMNASAETTLGFPEGMGFFKKIPPNQENTHDSNRYSLQFIDWDANSKSERDGQYNNMLPRHLLPGLYPNGEDGHEDEGVIAPFTLSSYDALKMVTYDQIRALRNFVEPCYAYTLDSYTGEYPTMRASYELRESADQNIIYKGRRATISPVVLASTDDGHDSYQTYFSGDLVYGNVKEFFPSGYTWWHLKNVIGGRYTLNKGGHYHMDDGIGGRMSGGSGGEYTCGNRTVAKCALSIYGVLPLDKEIVAAYIIVSPSGVDPSKDPIGRSWTGGPVMYCHYHAKTVYHPNYGDGEQAHLHGTAGYPDGQWFDGDGGGPHPADWVPETSNEVTIQDYSQQRHWGAHSEDIEDDRNLYYESNFESTMQSLPGMRDIAFYRNVGTPKTNVLEYGSDSKVVGTGYNASSFGSVAGFMAYNISNTPEIKERKYHYICLNSDNDIVAAVPDSAIWKTKTEEQIQTAINANTAEIMLEVTDGTEDGTVSYKFYETDEELYKDLVPSQTQPISNYFDMSWANTKGYVENLYDVDEGKPTEWSAPVIFQDAQEPDNYEGIDMSGQVGKVARVIPITDIVTRLYNNRIERDYNCKAGATFEEVMGWTFYPTVLGGTLKALDADVSCQNNSIIEEGLMLLNDCATYPKLENEGEVPSISNDGDKYELAPFMCEIVMDVALGSVISAAANAYSINENVGALVPDTRVTIEFAMDCARNWFGSLKGAKIEQISNRRIKVTCLESIEIKDIANNCYSYFGLHAGNYIVMQDRVVSVTNYSLGHHPSLLEESRGGWYFSTYIRRTQSFVMDLLRAPLCIEQRDYRYEKAGANYSNCKCPQDNCKAHDQGCAVAANNCNKNFDPSQPICPFGHSLEGASGVVYENGDGIMTYEYDKAFSPDPFIKKIIVKPIAGCSYRVLTRPNAHQEWKSLVNVYYDNGKYYEMHPNYNAMGTDAPPSAFYFNGNATRGRYVKVEVDGILSSELHQYLILSVNKFQITVSGDFYDMQGFSASGCQAVINGTAYTIVSTCIIDSNTMRITLSRDAADEMVGSMISFSMLKQVGGIEQFEVFGVHYKTEEGADVPQDPGASGKYLTITDFEDVYTMQLSMKQTKYKLPQAPTQILEVSIGIDGSSGVALWQSDSPTMYWSTISTPFVSAIDGQTHYYDKIVSGSYYYDVDKKTIVLPRYNHMGKDWGTFLDGIPVGENEGYAFNSLTIRYWSGNGKEVTLDCEANGNGPSYMVEKNAIQIIDDETLARLPDNGYTCDMLDANGLPVRRKIAWFCYNNEPATLSIEDASKSNKMQGTWNWKSGEFRTPQFSGNEIGDKLQDDMAFIKLFGDHAQSCFGKCKTTVTFTGAPNQILSGSLKVIAPEKVQKVVQIEQGNAVRVNERTGGISQGFFVVKCYPTSFGAGRMTKTYTIPKLLIYARERKLDEPL